MQWCCDPGNPFHTSPFHTFLILKRGSSSAEGTPCARALPAWSPPGQVRYTVKMHGFPKVSILRSPPGVVTESPRSPPEAQGVPTESPRKPHGVPMESPRSPCGVPAESRGVRTETPEFPLRAHTSHPSHPRSHDASPISLPSRPAKLPNPPPILSSPLPPHPSPPSTHPSLIYSPVSPSPHQPASQATGQPTKQQKRQIIETTVRPSRCIIYGLISL